MKVSNGIFCREVIKTMNWTLPIVALVSATILAVALAVLFVPLVTGAPLVLAATVVAFISGFSTCVTLCGSFVAVCNVSNYVKASLEQNK